MLYQNLESKRFFRSHKLSKNRKKRCFLLSFLLVFLCPVWVNSLEQSYVLFESGGSYYLKADPKWVPIVGDILVFIPVYEDGQVLELTEINGVWSVANISYGEFSSINPSLYQNGLVQYLDINLDGFLDIRLTASDNEVISLIYSSSLHGFSVQPYERQVVFIHTDLLGSPVAETDENGELLAQ